MTLTTGGNVGIGTTTPASRLDVLASGSGDVAVLRVPASSRLINFYRDSVNFAITDASGVAGNGMFGITTTNTLAFLTNSSERMRIDSAGLVGIGTSTPYYPLSLPTSNNTYQATGTQLGFGNSGFSGYGPHIGTANRAYIHFTGPGGGSANSTWIHGYQVANPAGSNWIRVANGISGNPVTGFTIIDGAAYFYLDNNKTTGNPDYSPTLRSGQNQNGYFVGNTPGNSGTGYTFPATQDPSSNANTLDDYEEGTWTPRTGTGITVESATYTKIGNRVTISGTIIHTGSITSYDRIALPFAPLAPTSETRYTGGVQFFESGTGTSAINIRLLTQQNASPDSFFWGQSGTQQWPFSMTYDGTNGVSQYTFTLTYRV
jgi:hypothetical protein